MKTSSGNLGDNAAAPAPDQYSFSMPADIPAGKAILAWTWFNKVGNREMCMNCDLIDLTGGSAKRNGDLIARNGTMLIERDQAVFDKLLLMFKANVKNISADSCATPEGISYHTNGFPSSNYI